MIGGGDAVGGMNLELHYGPQLVGVIESPIWSDNTGYGLFRPATRDDSSIRRVWEFIAFSGDWHERLRAGRSRDAAEFNAFCDIHESTLWHTVAPDGSVARISSPVFVQGEVTWEPTPKA